MKSFVNKSFISLSTKYIQTILFTDASIMDPMAIPFPALTLATPT